MDWTQIVIVIIQLVLAPMIILGVKEGISYLKAKAKNEKLDRYFAYAEDAILTAVTETQQIFVDEIKGTQGWSMEAMERAFNRSMNRSKAIMGDAVYEGLSEAVDDINAWITAKIEQAVHETKASLLPMLPEVELE